MQKGNISDPFLTSITLIYLSIPPLAFSTINSANTIITQLSYVHFQCKFLIGRGKFHSLCLKPTCMKWEENFERNLFLFFSYLLQVQNAAVRHHLSVETWENLHADVRNFRKEEVEQREKSEAWTSGDFEINPWGISYACSILIFVKESILFMFGSNYTVSPFYPKLIHLHPYKFSNFPIYFP